MPGLDFKSGDEQEQYDPVTAARNARVGGILFVLYLLVYGGFVWLNAFRPELMATTPIAEINLAIVYGFALIFGALLVALFYGWLCRNPASESDSSRGER